MMHHRFCKEVIETPTIATLAACGIDCKQRISFRARRLFARNASYRQRSVPRQK